MAIQKKNYRVFLYEGIRITVFCILVTAIFWLIGAKQSTLLIVFNVAVMACAATFVPERRNLWLIAEGAAVIILSIILGGVSGYYFPISSKILSILFAIFAFLLTRDKLQNGIFVTSAVMFLIFTELPFDASTAITNGLYSLIIIPLIVVFYWITDRRIYFSNRSEKCVIEKHHRIAMAYIVGLALLGSWILEAILNRYTSITHLYWIGLTVLVVIQSSQGKTIKISLVRILVNTIGAALVIVIMTYLMPLDFWVNFTFLVMLLFGIFSLGYSYIGRTLFIEMFVLSFTHILGNYHNIVAYDRILLTFVGGCLVILSTLVFHKLKFLPKEW